MAIERTTRQQEQRNMQANLGRNPEPYQVGEYVVVKTNGTGLQPRWSKPYLIISTPRQMELILQDLDPKVKNKTRRVHVQHVKKWFPAEPWCREYGYLSMTKHAKSSNQVQVGSRKQNNRGEASRPDQPRSPSSVSVTSRPSVQTLDETESIAELPPRHRGSREGQVSIDNHPNKSRNVLEQQQQQSNPRPRHNYNTRLNARVKNPPYPTQVITRYLYGRQVTQVIPRFLGYRTARQGTVGTASGGNIVTSQPRVGPFRFPGGGTRIFTPSAPASNIPRL